MRATKKNHNGAIDAIRIAAILGVIMIHTTTRILETSRFDVQNYQLTLFLNQAARFAVPVFFMISGYVLQLSYKPSAGYFEYLKKRLNRIFVPYVLWSAIYYLFVYKQHNFSFPTALMTGAASYQLYFLPALLVCYLIFPVLYKYFKKLTENTTLSGLGAAQFGLLYYNYFVKPLPIFYPAGVALLNIFVFILGMGAAGNEDRLQEAVRRNKNILMICVLFLAGYIFIEGKSRYLQSGNYLAFYSSWRPSVLVYSIIAAWLMYYFFQKHQIFASLIKTMSGLSFLVFFIHVAVLETVWSGAGDLIFRYMPNFGFFALTAGFSYFTAFALHKIKPLAKFTG
ncbi:hypothetical protein A2701_04815 [Candidatus Amesbacteria bacterium RIFCSPHIGHO2_01_FULL_47_34]|uniref:Acyltransferase 3 domain-containing protein n=2 Tax=Candidatus Amesiibacteriota TaxID=1752730 RepID=A0A1F4ZVV5_9BACT|nr:MAG: hypothetical protein A2701_04815 [Candidatus Amesbacteria bacterium RIFCSPHIGHO2_01_FULL_47_34]OGD01069.1 MAG: hypothetical protein A2972_03095 [Candidatus Amesbacteria bacterium RIFCSPLOWO2_01_FULL_47_33]OGD10471.1 MAG: hypothetical protein A2395_01600 [Candidatus Amesbacteria bacterium RIFOXYB1_FULL_47_9]